MAPVGVVGEVYGDIGSGGGGGLGGRESTYRKVTRLEITVSFGGNK